MKKNLLALSVLCLVVLSSCSWRRKKVQEQEMVTEVTEMPVRGSGPDHWGIAPTDMDEEIK